VQDVSAETFSRNYMKFVQRNLMSATGRIAAASATSAQANDFLRGTRGAQSSGNARNRPASIGHIKTRTVPQSGRF
jgi:hypothetical protein